MPKTLYFSVRSFQRPIRRRLDGSPQTLPAPIRNVGMPAATNGRCPFPQAKRYGFEDRLQRFHIHHDQASVPPMKCTQATRYLFWKRIPVEDGARAAAVKYMNKLSQDECCKSYGLCLDQLTRVIRSCLRRVSQNAPSVHKPINTPRLTIFQLESSGQNIFLGSAWFVLHQILLRLIHTRAPLPAGHLSRG